MTDNLHSVLDGLRNSDAKYKFGSKQFFHFMYADEKEDPLHPNVGFCRHPIMKNVCISLMFVTTSSLILV